MAHWWQSGEQVILAADGDVLIGVCATAYDGSVTPNVAGARAISGVVIKGDCATTTAVYQIVTDTDPAGNPRTREGWWIKIRPSLFNIISTSGAVRLFAEVTRTDGSMQETGNRQPARHPRPFGRPGLASTGR